MASDFPLTQPVAGSSDVTPLGRRSSPSHQDMSLQDLLVEFGPEDEIPWDHPTMARIFGNPPTIDPTTGQPVPKFNGNILRLIIQYGPQLIALWQQIAPIFSGGTK